VLVINNLVSATFLDFRYLMIIMFCVPNSDASLNICATWLFGLQSKDELVSRPLD